MPPASSNPHKYALIDPETLWDRLRRPSALKRFLFFFLGDILLIALSLYLAFAFRFDFRIAPPFRHLLLDALPLFILAKLVLLALARVYRMTWRFVGLSDLFNIGIALFAAEAALMAYIYMPLSVDTHSHLHPDGFPRSVFFIDLVLSFILISALRISRRIYLEVIRKKTNFVQGKRTLIVGAGVTGELVLRDMAQRDFAEFYPVGFLDDNPMKVGSYIHGVRVLGVTDRLAEAVKRRDVEVVIIAIPSTHYKALRKIHHAAREAGIQRIKIVPQMYKHHERFEVHLKDLSEISIEDLIGRQAVEVEYDRIEQLLTGKAIMVTGACGSIGAEIVRQVCGFKPASLILFEIDETELHNLRLQLNRSFPDMADRLHYVVGDVRDAERVGGVIGTHRPQMVFHAAAYKHVPMMEDNSSEAVKVNVFGTRNLARACLQYGVERFVMISTDKAVMPTSIMGATKRVAEYICTAFSREGGTEFTSVRFGNVLGSRGSVLPLFMEQLKRGGPLTVTDREMQRYFMTIPEAVSLVLQAAVIGKNGEVLVLDMGEPVRVVELAEELIRLHGLKPYDDIPIEFVGLRPGEKLFEEILTAEEGTEATRHQKVFVARNSAAHTPDEIDRMLAEFAALPDTAPGMDGGQVVKELLMRHVQHYKR
ncbi:polysaccharide biosynthesis protein [Geomobilimonas luticola]|uniref:Polysaccharide biosynthesis protein n=1 Tax=Geomobilimonas luticola TaxID=1114878 RepID=A0ABS5SF37_9BACT|nr:nucleoside-diphosphate sugar epimerase/dehydratase [Geomobilimonas luticola]MBT0653129.1 polysaccharide biosynthesis protein [Geomobilimonas luticola]